MSTVGDALETRENIPLQKGRKSASWCGCSEEYLSGFKFINVAFSTLTVIITVALLLQIYYGDYQVAPHGSVATDSLECSKIGTTILKRGGNSIDATIGSAFCLCVITPHLTSLDGEGRMLIYNHRKRTPPEVIDFSANVNAEHLLPRLVIGLAYLHQQYGTLAWKELVQPAADLAKQGFLVPKMLVQAQKRAKAESFHGHLEAGQLLPLETLGNTLEQIANIPEKELYAFVTPQNQPIYSQALQYTFANHNIYVPNTPSIGPHLLTTLQRLETFNFSTPDTIKTEYIYRVAEVIQNVYNELNISENFHQGTSTNVAAIDLDDIYVSFTMGLYTLFGSGKPTSFGYTLNIRDSDAPCSRLPVIITDALAICGRRLVFGASDMGVATQLVLALLIGRENVTDAIEAPRFHFLNNGSLGVEGVHAPLFKDDVIDYLETLTTSVIQVAEPYMSSNIVEKVKDDLNSHSDSRGGGIASRF